MVSSDNFFDNPSQGLVGFMVFNAIFNIISVISWQSVLFVEEARQTLSHDFISSTPHHERSSNSQL